MKNLIVLIFITTLYSCQKEITFDGNLLYEHQPFIESILSPGENPKVYISNSLPFFNERVSPQDIFARNAEVSLSDGSQTIILYPDSTFDYFRCRWNPFYSGDIDIKQGNSYELIISLGGEIYQAVTTIDQAKVNIQGVKYTPEFFDVYGGHDGVVVTFNDAAEMGNFYRFQMDRWLDKTRLHTHVLDVIVSNCTEVGELFYTKDIGRTVFSDFGNNGKEISFNAEVSFEYLQGDTAYVYLQSIDEASAGFFKDLDKQLQSIQNPFVEPSFIHSTIEGAIGVFGSAVRSDPILFIYPQNNP